VPALSNSIGGMQESHTELHLIYLLQPPTYFCNYNHLLYPLVPILCLPNLDTLSFLLLPPLLAIVHLVVYISVYPYFLAFLMAAVIVVPIFWPVNRCLYKWAILR
jgi:hypothetical protein